MSGHPHQWLQIRGGERAADLGTWPNPDDPGEVEYRLRYHKYVGTDILPGDLMTAASYMSAYRALIELPQRERNTRISQIRAAAKNALDAD